MYRKAAYPSSEFAKKSLCCCSIKYSLCNPYPRATFGMVRHGADGENPMRITWKDLVALAAIGAGGLLTAAVVSSVDTSGAEQRRERTLIAEQRARMTEGYARFDMPVQEGTIVRIAREGRADVLWLVTAVSGQGQGTTLYVQHPQRACGACWLYVSPWETQMATVLEVAKPDHPTYARAAATYATQGR